MDEILPDVLQPGLRVVFCGSAVGNESYRQAAYYAHKQNRFWPTLQEIGLTPALFDAKDYPRVRKFKIGLTDLAKHVHGVDKQLKPTDDNKRRLQRLIERHQPCALAFTGKRPARVFLGLRKVAYGRQSESIGRTVIFVLPSPSPAARRYWDIGPWKQLATFVQNDRVAHSIP